MVDVHCKVRSPLVVLKNSVVALIPAIILSDDIVTLDCVPDISDVASLVKSWRLWGRLLSVKRMSGD